MKIRYYFCLCRTVWLTIQMTVSVVQDDTKKREILKNPTKIEEIQAKKLLTEIEPLQLAF